MSGQTINTNKVFSGVTIEASDSNTSIPINLDELKIEGFFSIQYTATGTGTFKLEYEQSNNGVDFTGTAAIATGLTSGSDILSFTPVLSKYIRIIATETGGANSVGLNAWLAFQ